MCKGAIGTSMKSTALNKVRKIDGDLYVITETESIHCYLLLGKEKALLIDAGYGYEDIHPLIGQITELPVMLAVTHGDPDHALGAMHFEDVWIHPLDYGKLLMNDTPEVKCTMLEHRYHKMPETRKLIDKEAYLATSVAKASPHFLKSKDIIDLGGKHVEIFHTPGHSYGHIMFLERETGRLFSGDQLTGKHNNWHFMDSDTQAPFALTYASLKKLAQKEEQIKEIYPAHGEYPLSLQCLTDMLECFAYELAENYEKDIPFHSAMGDAWQHLYKEVNLIYSDERLEEFLGHPIIRNCDQCQRK